jgi:hypothetical protein
MAKIFETSKDLLELANSKFEDAGLTHTVSLRVLSTKKAKNVLKVSRANAILNGVTKDDVVLVIYEEAFDRLSDEFKEKLMEGAFSGVSYDSEKDKINVDGDIAKEIFRMRKKYQNYVDIVETSYLVIEQIEDEEKQRKEEEKLRKAEERAAKKRNNG